MKKISLVLLSIVLMFTTICCTLAPAAWALDATELKAVFGDTLSDVDLPDGYKWTAENPDKTYVGSVGTNKFEASYTTDEGEETVEVSVNVSPAYFSSVVVETDGNSYYTGKKVEPQVFAFFKGEKLVENKDYTVSYEDNIDIGTAKAIVEGVGNFKGKSVITFYIQKIDVIDLTLSAYEAELAPGGVLKLDANVVPANASIKEVEWKSSDESVATVDENGNVKALKNGVAEITAVSKDGGFEATCTVNVVTHIADMKISVGNVTMFYKETYQLKTVMMPYDASDKTIVWTSSDADVAVVDENGLVTATGKGDATITATTVDGQITDTCEISVRYNWWQRILWVFLGCLWYF